MPAVAMMQVSVHYVVGVITVWNSFMPAACAMDMGLVVIRALVTACTVSGLIQRMLINMILMLMV